MAEKRTSNNRYTWLGVGVFLFVDLPIHFGQCLQYFRFGGSDSACSHSDLPSLTPYILGVVVVLVGLSVLSERGKWFAKGFANALWVTTVLTLGRCTFLWADPVNDLWRGTYAARSHFASGRKTDAARAGWENAMGHRSPDLPRAMALAGRVRACTFSVPPTNLPYVPTDAEVMARCGGLVITYAGTDTARSPNRYVTPRAASNSFDLPAETGDAGWRWARDAKDSMRVEVSLDSILDRPWPRVAIDEEGTLTIMPTRKGVVTEVSPAVEFQQLRQCLASVPLELEQRRIRSGRAPGPYPYEWALVPMVEKLCPALAKRVTRDPLDGNNVKAVVLTVARRLPGSKELVSLAHYSVVLSVESDAPFRFALHASLYGARSYDMNADGEFY